MARGVDLPCLTASFCISFDHDELILGSFDFQDPSGNVGEPGASCNKC